MSFIITEHIDQLENFKKENTWAEATCPVCKGKLKINLSSKTGAYACYTEGCHNLRGKNLIRDAMYKPSIFRKNSVFKELNKKTSPKLPSIVTTKTAVSFKIADYKSNVEYTAPFVVSATDRKTTYEYDGFRVCRIDREGEKFLYTEYLLDGVYVKGTPSSFKSLPLYKNKYLQEHIIFVEGEKCADILHQKGFAAVTPHISVFNEAKLRLLFLSLKDRVHSIVYLEDNDIAGKKKAEWVTTTAWLAGINCVSINLAEQLNLDIMEYDVADAVEDGYDIEQELQKSLWRLSQRTN